MNLARYIDHTLLKPDATKIQIRDLCAEAKRYQFHAVCVNPDYIQFCKNELHHTSVKICTVIGFPLGAVKTKVKAYEASEAISDGADELDMVINIGLLKSKDYIRVEKDIKAVVKAAFRCIVKVIIETALLNNDEKVKACQIIKSAGADYVKTSTGFAAKGAKIADIKLIRQTLGPDFGIKAAGGIKTWASAMAMIKAGANRIGASNSVAIISEQV